MSLVRPANGGLKRPNLKFRANLAMLVSAASKITHPRPAHAGSGGRATRPALRLAHVRPGMPDYELVQRQQRMLDLRFKVFDFYYSMITPGSNQRIKCAARPAPAAQPWSEVPAVCRVRGGVVLGGGHPRERRRRRGAGQRERRAHRRVRGERLRERPAARSAGRGTGAETFIHVYARLDTYVRV